MTKLICLCLTALTLIISASTQATDTETPWTISNRNLPSPTGASKELHSAIATTDAPNVAGRLLVPTDNAQWQAIIDQQDSEQGTSTPGLAKMLGVSITPGEINGVKISRIQPTTVDPSHEGHLFVHLHGGGYLFGNGKAGLKEALIIASRLKMLVLSIDYRMPPAHPFPAALDDVIEVYRRLLKDHPASSLALGGTSAGGGLTLASTLKITQLDLDAPAALFLGSPWVDLTKTGDTLYSNEGIDRVLVTYDGLVEAMALLYANGQDLKNPLISPIYGSFKGFPPTQLVTGTRDLFLSDTSRTHRKLRAAGVVADLNVYEGMSHAGYLIVATAPESLAVYRDLNAFLLEHLE